MPRLRLKNALKYAHGGCKYHGKSLLICRFRLERGMPPERSQKQSSHRWRHPPVFLLLFNARLPAFIQHGLVGGMPHSQRIVKPCYTPQLAAKPTADVPGVGILARYASDHARIQPRADSVKVNVIKHNNHCTVKIYWILDITSLCTIRHY